MKKITIFLVIMVISSVLWSINDNAGTSGFNFLKMDFSARAAAMGGAFTGLAEGTDGISYNPAGLAQSNYKQISTAYMNYIDGIHIGSVSLVYSLDNKTGISVFGRFLSTEDDRTLIDDYGNYIGTDGTFGMSDLIFGVGMGRVFNESIDIGVNVKYIQESLDKATASAVALDFSIMHQTINDAVKVGLSYKNVGKQLSYFTDSEYEENLPTEFVAGIYFHPTETFKAVLDVSKPKEYDLIGKLGAEFQIHELLNLRTGYKTNAGDWRTGGDIDFLAGLSFGAGFNWKSYIINYAVSSYGDLGLVNQISINYRF